MYNLMHLIAVVMYVIPENLIIFGSGRLLLLGLLFVSIYFKLPRHSASVNRPSHSFPCSSNKAVLPSGKKMFTYV